MNTLQAVGLLLLIAGIASACMTPNYVEIAGNTFSAWGISDDLNQSMNSNYGESWGSLNLNDSQILTIQNFVASGFSVKQMSEEEYDAFNANAIATNADESTCAQYSNITYSNGFAAFRFDENSAKNSICASMTNVARCTIPSANATQVPGYIPSIKSESDALVATAGTELHAESNGNNTLLQLIPYAAVAIIAAFGAMLIINPRREYDADIHRALGSETRVMLMKELASRDLTPTDLSTKVGKSKATVVEHLDRLREAELVEKIEVDGKKFVFYRLTPKGKDAMRAA